MTKRDSKTGYSLIIYQQCTNCIRASLGHDPLSFEELKGLAELVKEASLVKHPDDFDYTE